MNAYITNNFTQTEDILRSIFINAPSEIWGLTVKDRLLKQWERHRFIRRDRSIIVQAQSEKSDEIVLFWRRDCSKSRWVCYNVLATVGFVTHTLIGERRQLMTVLFVYEKRAMK